MQIGDKVSALMYPNNIVIGILKEIRGHMAAVENRGGIIQWTPLAMVKAIKT